MILETLKSLQKELSFFIISIVISAVIFLIFHSMRQSSIEGAANARVTLQSAKNRYHTALEKKRIYETYKERFDQLVKDGIYGDEQRLNWIDAIEKTANVYKIPYLKYKIEHRVPVSSPELTRNHPGIQLYKSSMDLDMQLLHEGDLYTVINHVEKYANGLFDVQKCALNRNLMENTTLVDSKTGKNFSARCTLNWYTIHKKKQVQPPTSGLLRRRS